MKNFNLSDFQIQPTRGYLPAVDPLEKLSDTYRIWDEIIDQLPQLLESFSLGDAVDQMPLLDDDLLEVHELGRAKLILGMLAQTYVWEPKFHDDNLSPRENLPEQVAKPLMSISEKLDEPPIFNYADYVLRNWKMLDPKQSLTIDNLTTLATFSDRDDEKMFVVVHVAYEYVAGRSFGLGESAMTAAETENIAVLTENLLEIAEILRSMKATFLSVKNVVSPDIFRNYIRLYLKGWKNNTWVNYGDVPSDQTQFRGETGSQSSVIPFFDALFSIYQQGDDHPQSNKHEWNQIQRSAVDEYLDFRNYMPVGHREFIRFVEGESCIRDVVIKHGDNMALVNAYNQCVHGVAGMRQGHKSTVNPYIGKPGQLGNLGYGTGGSDYQEYLGSLHAITESNKVTHQEVITSE